MLADRARYPGRGTRLGVDMSLNKTYKRVDGTRKPSRRGKLKPSSYHRHLISIILLSSFHNHLIVISHTDMKVEMQEKP